MIWCPFKQTCWASCCPTWLPQCFAQCALKYSRLESYRVVLARDDCSGILTWPAEGTAASTELIMTCRSTGRKRSLVAPGWPLLAGPWSSGSDKPACGSSRWSMHCVSSLAGVPVLTKRQPRTGCYPVREFRPSSRKVSWADAYF